MTGLNPVDVHGGVGGISAHVDDLHLAAGQIARLADDMGRIALQLHAVLVDPALLASAAFDPLGAADVGAALAEAADGPGGVVAAGLHAMALAVALRTAAARYEALDDLRRLAGPIPGLVRDLPAGALEATAMLVRSGLGAGMQHLVTRDPQLADVAINTLAAAWAAGTTPEAMRRLADLFPDGRPAVTALGGDPAADATGTPRSLRDLLAGLDRRNAGRPGEVDVRILATPTARSGPRRVVVDVPGTKSWSLAAHNPDVTSVATNLRALAGEPTAYEHGIGQAMRRAGVRPNDDVVLVGHSEGGLVAVNAVTHFARTGEFHVGRVITAGAPAGLLMDRVPATVQVLALENAGDVVTHLDGRRNPDRANVTTVTLHRDRGDVGRNHDLADSYLPGADDVVASPDPSVQAYLRDLAPFLGTGTVHTERYLITRVY
jgi:hypothetical protein